MLDDLFPPAPPGLVARTKQRRPGLSVGRNLAENVDLALQQRSEQEKEERPERSRRVKDCTCGTVRCKSVSHLPDLSLGCKAAMDASKAGI